DLGASKEMLAKAFAAWDAIRSPNLAAAALNFGLLCQQTADYSQALGLLIRARELFRQRGHLRGIALAQNNLALVYLSLHQPAPAAESLTAAIRTLGALHDGIGQARARVNLGHIYLVTGRPLAALQTLRLASEQVRRSLDERAVADVE